MLLRNPRRIRLPSVFILLAVLMAGAFFEVCSLPFLCFSTWQAGALTLPALQFCVFVLCFSVLVKENDFLRTNGVREKETTFQGAMQTIYIYSYSYEGIH